MAAISLTSAAANATPRVTPATPPLGATAPSTTLPMLFTIVGLLALFFGAGWLIAQPELLAFYHYTPGAIAVTHLFVLGWVGSVVMGAMYQLVPVALETKLFSERLAQIQFLFHTTGFIGMVWAFHVSNVKGAAGFGACVVVGVGMFVFNLVQTLRRVKKWNVIATSIASAIGWVLLAVLVGLTIALARALPDKLPALASFDFRFDPLGAMHAHAHLGAVGFFTLLIVGVSYKLIPMFTLSELQNARRAVWSIWLLNLGLGGVFFTILLRSAWKPVGALVILLALALYTTELRAILRARKRRVLDWGVRSFVVAVALLLPLGILGVVLALPGLPVNGFMMQLENVYGFLALLGVVTLAIIGMLYKIVPFLVWFGTYSPHIGKVQVPALADMYSPRLQVISFWIFLAGLLATLAAMALGNVPMVRIGCGVLAGALVVFGINIAQMLRHYFCPQLKPLPKIHVNRQAL